MSAMLSTIKMVDTDVVCKQSMGPKCPLCRQGWFCAFFRTPEGVRVFLINASTDLLPLINVKRDGRTTPKIQAESWGATVVSL